MKSQRTQSVFGFIRSQVPFKQFLEQPLLEVDGTIVGYDVHAVLDSGDVIASGTHESRDVARQIAVAETLERIAISKLAKSDQAESIGLKKLPSTSGFAVGFDSNKARFRAICEGLERWIWSQWIDRNYEIPIIHFDNESLSPLGRKLSREFDNVQFRSFSIVVEELNLTLRIGVVLGFKDSGIFAGSRVSSSQGDIWTHSLIEAVRNLTNFKLHQNVRIDKADWFMNRVYFHGVDCGCALNQIRQSVKKDWPKPKIELIAQPNLNHDLFFLWRCLFSDFIPWHEGSADRFVY